jgi:hypothetical protein
MSRMAQMRWEMSKFGANLPEIGAVFPQISRTHSILTMFFSKRQHS